MHLRLTVMIAKIAKTFHIIRNIFVWLKIWNVLCQSCFQRTASWGLNIMSFFRRLFVSWLYFVISRKFVLLVLRLFFHRTFPLNPVHEMNKGAGFALWISLPNRSSGSENITRIQKASRQIFNSGLALAAQSFEFRKIFLFYFYASWRDVLSCCQGIWKGKVKHLWEVEPQNFWLSAIFLIKIASSSKFKVALFCYCWYWDMACL